MQLRVRSRAASKATTSISRAVSMSRQASKERDGQLASMRGGGRLPPEIEEDLQSLSVSSLNEPDEFLEVSTFDTGVTKPVGHELGEDLVAINDALDHDAELNGVDAGEFDLLRYTPVTTQNPIHLGVDGYKLRCQEMGRHIDNCIGVTMYNEDWDLVQQTLQALGANMQSFCRMQGSEAWKHSVVVVLIDGLEEMDQRAQMHLQLLGAFDTAMLRTHENNLPVQLHVFEVTLEMTESISEQTYYAPMQLVLCVKAQNSGKLHSHLWFFNGICTQLAPKYTWTLDMGTLPKPMAMWRVFDRLEEDKQGTLTRVRDTVVCINSKAPHTVAGVTGQIAAHAPKLTNFVVAAQVFEYKAANILEKAMESVFGFLTVLPGAFSAYRWSAIREYPTQTGGENDPEEGAPDRKASGPLVAYFASITQPQHKVNPFTANLYLAEDRVLCAELLAAPGRKWVTRYVRDAVAHTDIPEDLPSLIKQRRRWLNGSFFALVYTLSQFGRFWRKSAHSCIFKIMLSTYFMYSLLVIAAGWFMLGNFFLAFFYVVHVPLSSSADGAVFKVMGFAPLAVYLSLLLLQLVFGLGNNDPRFVAGVHRISALFFGSLVVVFFASTVNLIQRDIDFSIDSLEFWVLILGVTFSFGVYLLAGLLHGELWSVASSMLQYFLMLPVFVNVLHMFAFANLHDVSWGSRQQARASAQAGRTSQQNIFAIHVGGRVHRDRGDDADAFEERLRRTQLLDELADAEVERVNEHKFRESFKLFRSQVLWAWLLSNTLLVGTVVAINTPGVYLVGILFAFIVMNSFKLIGSFIYVAQFSMRTCMPTTSSRKKQRKRRMYAPHNEREEAVLREQRRRRRQRQKEELARQREKKLAS
ncbi:MAG: hypothetical protein MHM6MM_000695 [Cercozoa sp. M6MM]